MLYKNQIPFLTQYLPFWNDLTQSQKDLLIQSSTTGHFQKGQPLLCGQYDCVGLLLVTSGNVRTYISSVEGREITLFRLEPSDICVLSASCVLEAVEFNISIEALTDCDIIQISSSAFAQLMSENIHVELFSYKASTSRFSTIMWVMQSILFTSFDKRLASFLLEESQKTGNTDLRMTQEEIAKYLGSAREVVSRMLNYFSKEGYVVLSRGHIKIADRKALSAIASLLNK